MRAPLLIISTALTALYPFLWWGFLKMQWPFWALAVLMCVIWAVQGVLSQAGKRYLSLVASLFFAAIAVLQFAHLLWWYPVFVNLVLLAIFAGSLFYGKPLIERFARLKHPDLPARGVRYTRQVTKVWCGFFIINTAIIIALILTHNIRWWSLYCGAISYALIAALFIGEWGYRQWRMK